MLSAIAILSINICLCAIFASIFLLVAIFQPKIKAAKWIVLAYLIELISLIADSSFYLNIGSSAVFWFLSVMSKVAALLVVIHLMHMHYEAKSSFKNLVIFFLGSFVFYLFVFSVLSNGILSDILFQLPLVLCCIYGAAVVARSRSLGPFEHSLVIGMLLGAVQFVMRPILALEVLANESTSKGVLGHAAEFIDYSSGAIYMGVLTIFATVFILLQFRSLIVQRQSFDPSTGFLNAAIFNGVIGSTIVQARMGTGNVDRMTLTVIYIDNAGEKISDVASAISDSFAKNAAGHMYIGRMATNEFGIFDPRGKIFFAREAARELLDTLEVLHPLIFSEITVSIGITEGEPQDGVWDMILRAEWARDVAKKTGSNAIRLAARSGVNSSVNAMS